MRMGLAVIAFTLVAVGILWMLPIDKSGELPANLTGLPWQVEPLQDGSSRVLGLHLGEDTLNDAIAQYGIPESMALFIAEDKMKSLEVYFGTIRKGPLEAKLILALDLEPATLERLVTGATGRKKTRSGDIRLTIDEVDKESLRGEKLAGITYIPIYGKLDEKFFLERLGEPDIRTRENEQAVVWHYPELGLSLLIDNEGKEAFEYRPPRNFALPETTPETANGEAPVVRQ